MKDQETGISIRFIKKYDMEKDKLPIRDDWFMSAAAAAMFLAMKDERDVPMAQKVSDAGEFMHSRLESAER